MKKIKIEPKNKIVVEDIEGFFKKVVNVYGTGAKIDCPKVYLGKEVYVIVKKEKKK
jgi:putative transposon-encoded protein